MKFRSIVPLLLCRDSVIDADLFDCRVAVDAGAFSEDASSVSPSGSSGVGSMDFLWGFDGEVPLVPVLREGTGIDDRLGAGLEALLALADEGRDACDIDCVR